ncbi:FAD-dependent oxidoreductase [Streptomyces boluensis]|uniref:FAD-dependent oxidoreductase n=1 Tax=Streptomyces boluensis TaxID=1775135 RepID=A0A964XP41_9ACTN|nr:FAD-dependent oxidoreductase [Streptomyces boluensis]NBE54233.1 FAD-dependent oxidoreductase [Streptomyces boluensis]
MAHSGETQERTTCCIVGGGPAGMMLGLLLARAGVRVTVLEKHRDFLRDFRGDTVHPSTLRLLDELGLGARFAALPAGRLDEMRIRIGTSTVTLADFRRMPGRTPHKYIAMVPQWDFLDLLAEAAAAEPTFTLRRSTAVTGLTTLSDGRVTGVRLTDEHGTAGELAADLVVACDGRGSVVARAAGLRQNPYEVPMDVWQVRVPAPAPDSAHSGRVLGYFGDGQVAVTMDRGDWFQTSYLIKKGTDAELRRQDVSVLRERLGLLFGWGAETTAAIASWDDVKMLDVTMGRLPRWYTDGLLCIGDAAHTMSPVGGVGVNLAVQDAVATARLLAGPLLHGRVQEADLARVQKRRALPMAVTQKSQLAEHDLLIRPALDGTLDRVPLPMRLTRRFPLLQGIGAYVGGMGVRPEHAPQFARRAPAAPVSGRRPAA